MCDKEGKIKDWSSFVVPLVAGFIKEEKAISRQFLISSRKGTSKNVPDFLMSFLHTRNVYDGKPEVEKKRGIQTK